MIYQFDSRVRYSEVDENRRITLLSILNYFQDCSSFHSEKIGFGIDYLKEKQCAWVLSSWQIVLGELPVFGQEITVQTWPYSFKGFLGERNFCIRDEKGEKLAKEDVKLGIILAGEPNKYLWDEIGRAHV